MTTHGNPAPGNALALPGLDGSSPLGFLAALGLYRTISLVSGLDKVTFRWMPQRGTWVPELAGAQLDQQTLVDALGSTLVKNLDDHPIHLLKTLGSSEGDDRTELFRRAARDPEQATWLAALGSSVTPSTANNQLQTVRRDYYYGNLESIIARTRSSHLERTLFHPWDYQDPLDNQSLHLDPSEDRRHALQWNKPAGDPNRKKSGGMLGANRLAIEAIGWFVSLPEGDNLHTIGFTGHRSKNTRWTWPIWAVPLDGPSICSTLTLPELQEKELSGHMAASLRHRGIAAAFRTARILVGKTPNFTPPRQIA